MGLKKGQKPLQKWKNTIRLPYICCVFFCRCQVVFFCSFISALFLSFFQAHPYLKWKFTVTFFPPVRISIRQVRTTSPQKSSNMTLSNKHQKCMHNKWGHKQSTLHINYKKKGLIYLSHACLSSEFMVYINWLLVVAIQHNNHHPNIWKHRFLWDLEHITIIMYMYVMRLAAQSVSSLLNKASSSRWGQPGGRYSFYNGEGKIKRQPNPQIKAAIVEVLVIIRQPLVRTNFLPTGYGKYMHTVSMRPTTLMDLLWDPNLHGSIITFRTDAFQCWLYMPHPHNYCVRS